MREIKYRAYVKHLQIIIEVQRINFDCKTIEGYIVHPDEGDMSEFSFDEVELMQYTGLKDNNGKEIYEGDIYITYDDFKDTYQVMYKKGAFVGGKNRNKCSPIGWENLGEDNISKSNFHKESITVIGNIYENPELLGNQSN